MKLILDAVRHALTSIQDPELKFPITDLGLIYDLQYDPVQKHVTVTMTLTSLMCPQQDFFINEITHVVSQLPEVDSVSIQFSFDPPWSGEKAAPYIKEHFVLLGIPLTRF